MKGTAQTSNFFSAENTDAKTARENIAMEVLGELLEWLRDGGDVAVFDATNTTDERRRAVLVKCKVFDSLSSVVVWVFPQPPPFLRLLLQSMSEELNVIFVESICTDPEVIRKNMMQKASGSPDYRTMPIENAMADLQVRITNYEKVYETIEDDTMSYIKLINLQSKVCPL